MYGPGRLDGPHYTLGRKCWAVSHMMGVLGRALQLTTDMERSAVNTLELVGIASLLQSVSLRRCLVVRHSFIVRL